MSFIRSQRETWTTSGVSADGGAVWTTSTRRLTVPRAPSRRLNGTAGGVSVEPSSSPT
jgi:hypothetical protein